MHSQMLLNGGNYEPIYQYKEIYTAISQVEPDLKEIELLVKKHGIEVEVDNLHKLQPLHIACLQGKLNVVEHLVTQLGANIEAGTYTPLAYACRDWRYSDCKIALFLIKRGADCYKVNLGCTNEDLLSLVQKLPYLKIYSQSKKGSLALEIAKLFEKLKDPEEAQKYFRLAAEHGQIEAIQHITKKEEIHLLIETCIKGLTGKENEGLIQRLESIASPPAEAKDITPQQQFEAHMALGRIHVKYRQIQKALKYYEKAHGLKEVKKTPETETFLLACLPYNYNQYYDLKTNSFPEVELLNIYERYIKAAALGSREALDLVLDIMNNNHNYIKTFVSLFTDALKVESYTKTAHQIQRRYKKYTEALKERNNPRRCVVLLQDALKETPWADETTIKFFLADAAARVSIISEDPSHITTYRELSLNLYQQIADQPITLIFSIHCIFVLLKLFNHLTDKTQEKQILDLVIRFNEPVHFLHTIPNLEFLLSKSPDSFVLNHTLARCYRAVNNKVYLEKAIHYFETAARLDAKESETINKEIISIRKQIAGIPTVPLQEKLKHLSLASAAGDKQAEQMLEKLRKESSETKQSEVMTMFRGAGIQQACGNRDAKAIVACLTESMKTLSGSIVDHAEEFIKLEIIPAYEYASAAFLRVNPELAKLLISTAKELLKSGKVKMSEELRNFFEYYVFDQENKTSALQGLAIKGYLPAIVSLMEIYKKDGPTYRERAQILLKACVLMMRANTKTLASKVYIDKLNKLQSEAFLDLEAIVNDKTSYSHNSKKFRYCRLARTCYNLHQELEKNKQHPVNPLGFIIAKIKADITAEGIEINADLTHAFADAFDINLDHYPFSLDALIAEPARQVAPAAASPQRVEPSILETKTSQPLPKIEWFISDTPQTKLLTYTAFLLKQADLSKLTLKTSEYFLHLKNVSERRDLKVMGRFATWCMAQIDRVERAQDKPLTYLLENALRSNDELITQTALEAREELETLGLSQVIDEPQPVKPLDLMNDPSARSSLLQQPSNASIGIHEDPAFLATSKPVVDLSEYQNSSFTDNFVSPAAGEAYGHFESPAAGPVQAGAFPVVEATQHDAALAQYHLELQKQLAEFETEKARRAQTMVGPGVHGAAAPAPSPEVAKSLAAQRNFPTPNPAFVPYVEPSAPALSPSPSFAVAPQNTGTLQIALPVAPAAVVAAQPPKPAVVIEQRPAPMLAAPSVAVAPAKNLLVDLFGLDLFTSPATIVAKPETALPASNVDLLTDFSMLDDSIGRDRQQAAKFRWDEFFKKTNHNAPATQKLDDDVFAGLDFPEVPSAPPGGSTAKVIAGAGMDRTAMERGLLAGPAEAIATAAPVAVEVQPAAPVAANKPKSNEAVRAAVALV